MGFTALQTQAAGSAAPGCQRFSSILLLLRPEKVASGSSVSDYKKPEFLLINLSVTGVCMSGIMPPPQIDLLEFF